VGKKREGRGNLVKRKNKLVKNGLDLSVGGLVK